MPALLVGAVALSLSIGACSDDEPSNPGTSIDAGAGEGSTPPTTPDPIDGGATVDSGPTPSTGCSGLPPASSLPAPGPGQTVIVAALCEASADYNGLTTNFTGVALQSGAVKNDLVLSFSSGQTTARSIVLQLDDPNVTAGTTVTLPEGASETQFVYNDSRQGTTAKAYMCYGTVVIDSLEDKLYGYHFDVTCKTSPGFAAAGTVRMTGFGASQLR